MRKIVIGSGLGLVAAAIPAHGAVLPIAVEPAGVSDAGQVRLAPQGTDTQGVLIGLNKPGETQIKQEGTAPDSQVKMDPYAKMKAAAELKIKGESQIKLNGDGFKAGTDSSIKLKSGQPVKYGSGGGEGLKIKSGQQIKTGTAGLLCDGFGDGSVRPGQ